MTTASARLKHDARDCSRLSCCAGNTQPTQRLESDLSPCDGNAQQRVEKAMTINNTSEAAKAVVRRNTEEVQSGGNFEVFDELFADDFSRPHAAAGPHA